MTAIPKEQAQADIRLFEHYIPELKADPHCKHCFGKGYSGFGAFPFREEKKNGEAGRREWVVKLITCRCVTVGKTEFSLLKEQLDKMDQGLGFVHVTLSEQLQAVRRRTFFGAFEFLWGKVFKK